MISNNITKIPILVVLLIIPFIVNSTYYQANEFNDLTDTKTEVYNLSFNVDCSPFSFNLVTNTNVSLEAKSLWITGCIAGGPGSTSCSMEAGGISCSVSCGGGYYSCCSLTSGCKCVKQENSGGGIEPMPIGN